MSCYVKDCAAGGASIGLNPPATKHINGIEAPPGIIVEHFVFKFLWVAWVFNANDWIFKPFQGESC